MMKRLLLHYTVFPWKNTKEAELYRKTLQKVNDNMLTECNDAMKFGLTKIRSHTVLEHHEKCTFGNLYKKYGNGPAVLFELPNYMNRQEIRDLITELKQERLNSIEKWLYFACLLCVIVVAKEFFISVFF